jgi:hypothetical protein
MGTMKESYSLISQATDRYRVSSTGKYGRDNEKITPGITIIKKGSHNCLSRDMFLFLVLIDKIKISQIDGRAE